MSTKQERTFVEAGWDHHLDPKEQKRVGYMFDRERYAYLEVTVNPDGSLTVRGSWRLVVEPQVTNEVVVRLVDPLTDR